MVEFPRASDLMVAPTTKLNQLRPNAGLALYTGRYADVLRGWNAQAGRFLRYLIDESRAARLATAKDRALLDLIRSEFWADPDLSPQAAIGEAVLTRASSGPAGIIRTGHRFERPGNDEAKPAVAVASFTASEPVYIAAGQLSAKVPVVTAATGTNANMPKFVGESGNTASSSGALPAGFAVTALYSAGGQNGLDDPWLRLIAAATYAGFAGPQVGALIAGAFSTPGVRRIAHVLDVERAVARLFVADVSWASSDELSKLVKRNLRDKWIGWGGRVDVLGVQNVRCSVVTSVQVRETRFLDDAAGISDSIRKAAKAYFDERPDFYTWKLRALRAAIARSDNRILTCSSVSVVDSSGSEISEPSSAIASNATYAPHYYLIDDSVQISFSPPT